LRWGFELLEGLGFVVGWVFVKREMKRIWRRVDWRGFRSWRVLEKYKYVELQKIEERRKIKTV
jgi:hypothetical protein